MSDISVTDFQLEDDKLADLALQPAHKLDNQLHVQFYKHAELNAHLSRVEGRKIFEDKVYIRIMAPANRLNIIERQATDDDKVRFATHYTRFLQGVEQLAIGTPLSELTGLTPSQVLELKALKVDTVEQLAQLADTTAQLLGVGGQELKRRAQSFMARTASNEALASQNQALTKQIAELQALLQERLQAEQAGKDAKPAFSVTPKSTPANEV